MKAFVCAIFVVCCASYLQAAAVEVVKSEEKSVQSDVKQEKRSLNHGTSIAGGVIETSPITVSTHGAALPNPGYEAGWAPQPAQGWAPQPALTQGWASAPEAPQVVATNTDTLTTIRQNVPVPYPVVKTVQVDRPV